MGIVLGVLFGKINISFSRTAIVESICSAQDRDVILIAGKGHEDYQEIAGVRHPFDDLETAREAFNERYTRLAQKN